MSDTNNLNITSTDMMVNLLANPEKLVNTENRWNYGDQLNHGQDDDEIELDENIDQYVSDHPQSPHDSPNMPNNIPPMQNVPPQPTQIFQKAETHEQPNYNKTSELKHLKKESPDEDREMTKEEISLIKLDTLRKLGELKQCGVHLSQNYGMDSDLKMMQYELKLHTDIRTKQNSVQWMSHMMIGCVKGMEMLNDSYNPFDIKLAGLTDKVSSDMQNYYMVLGDIYEKYNQPGKQMAPEMRLILMLSGAALSMQASRIIPHLIPQLGGLVKNDDRMLNELRDKAQNNQPGARINEPGSRINEAITKEHDIALQKASDLQTIRDKELEYQRMKQIMEKQTVESTKPGNTFRSGLILSSEAPSKKNVRNRTTKKNDEPVLSNDELYAIQQHKYLREQQHFEKLRKQTNTNPRDDSIKDKMTADLQLQHNKLDSLMNSLEMKDNESDDNDSASVTTRSSMSSVSINPKIQKIMANTSQVDAKKKNNASIDDLKNKKKNGVKNDHTKKKNIVNNLDAQLEDLLSGEELSFGSSGSNGNDRKKPDANKKYKNTDKSNAQFGGIDFSVGSTNKGVKTVLKTGIN